MSMVFRETHFGSQDPTTTERRSSTKDGGSAEVSQVALGDIVDFATDVPTTQGALMSWRNETFKLKTRIQKVVNNSEFGLDHRPVSYKVPLNSQFEG